MKKNLVPLLVILIFSLSTFGCSDGGKKIRVSLLPLGSVSEQYLDSVRSAIQNEYHFDVFILSEIEIPDKFFVNIKSPRYRADSIIKYLLTIKPDSADYIIAVTEKDISVTKRDGNGNIKIPESIYSDWGVFGFGYVGNCSSVISTFRLKNADEKIFFLRMQKVALHELGHNLGLPHCKNKLCVMCDAAETIRTIDRVNKAICEECRRKIQ